MMSAGGYIGTSWWPSKAAVVAALSTAVIVLSASSSPVAQTTQVAPETDDQALIPGGEGFVRSVLGMAPRRLDQFGQGFFVEVVNQIAQPNTLNLPARLSRALDDLEDLRRFLRDLDDKYGAAVARLAAPDSAEYRRAEELLEYFGLRVSEVDGVFQHERVDSEEATARRRLLSQLGISLPVQMQLGAGGQPIVIEIGDTEAAVPFGIAVWQEQVFDESVTRENILRLFVGDDRARDILLAYAHLDRPTRDLLYREVGLRHLHREADWAKGFRRLAPYLRAEGGSLVLPGGDRAAWREILGPWEDTAELVRKATTSGGGRAAHLWRALYLVPESRARYLLTLNQETEILRKRWAGRLYYAIRLPEFGNPIRWPDDAAELFASLRLDPETGSIDWPGGARAWRAAFHRPEDPLNDSEGLEELLEELAGVPDSGTDVDAQILLSLLVNFDPRGGVTPAIRGFRAVSNALRYQPRENLQRAVTLLYRNYDRLGRAYGFLTVPAELSPITLERFVEYVHRVDSVEDRVSRAETIRQHQATLILLHRMLANDVIPGPERDSLLGDLFDTQIEPLDYSAPGTAAGAGIAQGTGAGESKSGHRGDARTLLTYLRLDLLPAVGRKLVSDGWEGDPSDLQSVLAAGLIGLVERAPVEVQGIAFEYSPTSSQKLVLDTHLRQQQVPAIGTLFELDALLDEISELPTDAATDPRRMGTLADRLEQNLGDLRNMVPSGFLDGSRTGAPPVPIPRYRLFHRGTELVQQLREGSLHPASGITTHRALASFMGDSLVGYVYALEMGDPDAVIYQRQNLSWVHRSGPETIPAGVPPSLYGPWAPTAISRAGEGAHGLTNSLFGVAGILGHWNLEMALPAELTSVDPLAEEAWGYALGDLHYPAFDREALGRTVRRHAVGEEWIRTAVASRNRRQPAPAAHFGGTSAVPPLLVDSLRPLLRAFELQRFIDAVETGDERAALALVSPGNRYLLARSVDGAEEEDPARVRWAIDQVAGMPIGRRGDYLGLSHPPALPQGEVGDDLRDPHLYDRLLDIRIRMAIEIERQGLPSALAARLLPEAMAHVLSQAQPLTVDRWRGIVDALERELSGDDLRGWMLDLAFADELLLPGESVAPERRQ